MGVRTFNTEGPVAAADHYHIPPLERIDLDSTLQSVRARLTSDSSADSVWRRTAIAVSYASESPGTDQGP